MLGQRPGSEEAGTGGQKRSGGVLAGGGIKRFHLHSKSKSFLVSKVLTGGDSKTKKVNLRGHQVHPSIEKAITIIQADFQKLCLEDQDILGSKDKWEKVNLNLWFDEH